ncbi:TRAP transporter, DctM subunit [Thiohalospira halophila DSM 15071]|uniref:TRAP transporter large permease protein n=1 Tax=Thiohalospira halophila DSM 15071 TaxID=1123397 RepID=A0A1I1RLT1_9GAMM|nr:TRAP transporter large permease subunit [Thiohalospira halophila]SFD33248.1 TRAP transporter, DctM subunit [Thiohalospira halophila DSM 15071]
MGALVLFAAVAAILLTGYPVAFALGGGALLVAGIATLTGHFDPVLLDTLPSRIYGVMTNQTLMAVPLFVFMGVVLERSRLAEDLLDTMAGLFGNLRGGMAIAVVLVGALMGASTGIIGATVVTMGLLALPTMLDRGHDPRTATGTICASGTLGQILPPSIILVLLGDVLGSAYQKAQLAQGNYSPDTVSVGDLFAGALLPGLLLVGLYIGYVLWLAWRRPERVPAAGSEARPGIGRVLRVLVPPLALIVAVLGSILGGIATPTEAAGVGAIGALILAAARRRLGVELLRGSARSTLQVTAMVFLIFIAASVFSLVFRGLGGDEAVESFLTNLPGGTATAVLLVMVVMFLLGFILDFIEITYVVVPVVAPALLMMGVDPVWLGVLIAMNLQTSFLTPPFGFALFYLRGVAPESVPTGALYRGALPFIALQLVALAILAGWPELATWLPEQIYG